MLGAKAPARTCATPALQPEGRQETATKLPLLWSGATWSRTERAIVCSFTSVASPCDLLCSSCGSQIQHTATCSPILTSRMSSR